MNSKNANLTGGIKSTKKGLNSFFRILIILLVGMFLINFLIFIIIYINHTSKLKKEEAYLAEVPGEYVTVDGNDIHIFKSECEGSDKTLVILHDSGITEAVVDIQPLVAELKDKVNIVYMDRSGNGLSLSNGSAKDIDSIVDDYRTVLSEIGKEGPYVLVGCGTGGIYAGYWAKKYPDEVEGIIGIGSEYADEYDGVTEESYAGIGKWLMIKATKLGANRLIVGNEIDNYHAIYTEKQMLMRKALRAKYFYTDDMYKEDLAMVDNALKAKNTGFPEDIPVLEIVTNSLMEPYAKDDSYIAEQIEKAKESGNTADYVSEVNKDRLAYFAKFPNVKCIEVSGPPELFTYAPEETADYIMEFLNKEIN